MNENYASYTDEELISMHRDGNSFVMDYLLNKYKQLVKSKAKSMYIPGGDNDDLVQEGMIGLFKAVRDFNASKDASFHTFADLCVTRQIDTAIKASNRQKHAPLNSYVSIDNSQGSDSENADAYIQGLLSAVGNGSSPEDLLINAEDARKLKEEIMDELSSFERTVLDLKLSGKGYVEIAKDLGKTSKSIDNALGRIKTKVNRILNEKD